MNKEQVETPEILEEPSPLGRAEHHIPKSWYEQVIFWAGFVFSIWILFCCVAESMGLWVRQAGTLKAYSALMWAATLFFAVSLILIFWDKARAAASILSFAGAAISVATGVSLSTADKLGYINNMGQTFTETTPFWWGHIIPMFVFLFCIVLWILASHRKKREEQMYELDLKEVQRTKKRGNRK